MLRGLAIVTAFVACALLSIDVHSVEALPPNNCAASDTLVRKYATTYEVPPDFAASVIAADIGRGTLGRNDAARYGLRYPVNRDASVRAIVQRLGALLKQFGGDQTMAAAAFDAGPTLVQKYHGVPPVGEARSFVKRVIRLQCSNGATVTQSGGMLSSQQAPPTGAQTGITVTAATYGASCGQPTGNVTPALKSACDGRAVCDYSVVWQVLGDPAYGCKKDFSVQWTCSNGGGGSASASAEAGYGSKVKLHC